MALTERIQTTTREEYMPMVVMTTLKASPLVNNVLKRSKKWRGTDLKIPADVIDTVQGQMFDGYDLLDTTTANDRRMLTFQIRHASFAISLAKTDIDLNKNGGETAFLDLVQVEVKSAAQKFAQFLANQMYTAIGVGNTFDGLTKVIDDGSVSVNYGGLSRVTYPTLQSTVTSVGGALTLAAMRNLYDDLSDGGTEPDEIYTTYAIRSAYEALATPFINIMRGSDSMTANSADIGFKSGGLSYKGMPIYADKQCQTGTLYMINSEYLNFYALTPNDEDSIPLDPGKDLVDAMYTGVKGFGISWTGWKEPVNQYAWIGHLMLHGNLVSDNPRRLGKLTNIT
jgi:hypothetical protein